MADRLLAFVAGTNAGVLALFAFLLAFGESAIGLDLLVPGETGMVVVGAAGARSGAALWPLIVAGTVGATLGDSVSYALGRRFGLRLAHRWRFTRRHIEPALLAAEQRFARHGGVAVAGARWVGALRAVVPAVAGAAEMPFRRFLAWNIPSSAAWAATTVTLGAVFGEMVADFVDRTGAWLSVGTVALIIVVVLVRRRRAAHFGGSDLRRGGHRASAVRETERASGVTAPMGRRNGAARMRHARIERVSELHHLAGPSSP